jgi:hypothetical protein
MYKILKFDGILMGPSDWVSEVVRGDPVICAPPNPVVLINFCALIPGVSGGTDTLRETCLKVFSEVSSILTVYDIVKVSPTSEDKAKPRKYSNRCTSMVGVGEPGSVLGV